MCIFLEGVMGLREREEEENVCPNCGQHTEGESECPNCGAILGNGDDEDDFDGFDDDEDDDDFEDEAQ
jgi:hypothetical protein